MQDVAENGRPGRGRGGAGFFGPAAVHHAGDLNRGRIPPGGPRRGAGDLGRVAGLHRRHQVEDHAVGDPAGQLEHPRSERGQVDRQAGSQRRTVKRHQAGAEDPAVVAAAAGRSVASFYNYYGTKADLLIALAEEFHAEATQLAVLPYRVGLTGEEALREAIAGFWHTYAKRRGELIGIFQAAMIEGRFRDR